MERIQGLATLDDEDVIRVAAAQSFYARTLAQLCDLERQQSRDFFRKAFSIFGGIGERRSSREIAEADAYFEGGMYTDHRANLLSGILADVSREARAFKEDHLDTLRAAAYEEATAAGTNVDLREWRPGAELAIAQPDDQCLRA